MNVVPGENGEHYVPYEERKGAESIVYFLFVLILTQVVLKAFNKRDVGL